MTVRERIDSDYLREVKAQQAAAVSTLRQLRAALKNGDIDKRRPLEETEIVGIIGTEIKKLKEAAEIFVAAGRAEMAASNEVEIALLSSYMPQQLTDEELNQIIRDKMAALGEVTIKDFGRVMGEVSKDTKGRADGTKVSAAVKAILSG